MRNKMIKSLLILFSVIIQTFFISCDLDDTPISYKPGYEDYSLDELMGFPQFYNVDVLFNSLITENDSSTKEYMLALSGKFQSLYMNKKDLYVGKIKIGDFEIDTNGNSNSYLFTKKYNTGTNPIEVNDSVLYYTKGDKDKYILERSLKHYFPKPLHAKCNFNKIDTINKNSDLTFIWTPDPNFPGKMVIIISSVNIYPEKFPSWHKYLNDSEGFVSIPYKIYLTNLKSGTLVKVTIARGTSLFSKSYYDSYAISTLSKSEFTYYVK